MVGRISHDGCEFSFELIFIGDCKSSSTNDFFGFVSDIQSLDPSFPVIFEGSYFLEMGLSDDFIFPSIIQNIQEIDTNNLKPFPDNKVIDEGCSQIFSAFSYFVDICGSEERTKKYLTIYEDTQPKFDQYVSKCHPTGVWDGTRQISYDEDVIKDFVNSAFESGELLKIIKNFTIHIGIPLMIIGVNNGLYRVELKDVKMDNLVNIGYSAFLYAPKEINSSSKMLVKNSNFDIVICDVEFLDECINTIEDGVRKSIHKILEQIRNNPHLLYYEIYNNSLNLRRLAYQKRLSLATTY